MITAQVHASITFCNYSSYPQIIASLGYWNSVEQVWFSKGWWSLDQGECNVVYGPEYKAGAYYVHGHTPDNVTQWGGDASFCTINSPFTIYGADQSCANGEFRSFSRVEIPDKTSDTYNFGG
jgi:uncharacterized membrane protein